MATASFDHVTKRFGEVVAVDDLSLDVHEGEFVVLVGPSGSGKTTALRLLAGLEAVSEGAIRIEGEVVNDRSPRDRDVAMVFQDYALYPQMTVFQNLAFALRIRKLPKNEIERKVKATAEMLGVAKLLDRKPRQLSGGQQQRVALGRALVREPKVFLMDEPLSNLDAQLRTQTRGEIKRLQQRIGVTTVYVTHDQVEAMTMGDRIAVMNNGAAVQVADAQTVYDEPANVFVAGFIGSPAMSFARFGCRQRDGAIVLARGEARLNSQGPGHDPGRGGVASAPAAGALPAEVVVGVRPENARLWEDGADLMGPLSGRVRFLEDLGRERFVGVELAPDSSFTLLVPGHASLGIDDTVRFGLERGRVHLFDPSTQDALARM